jgi:hypothetical protein
MVAELFTIKSTCIFITSGKIKELNGLLNQPKKDNEQSQ